MTRFARAKGSKASNERVPEEATPWNEMKQQLLNKSKEVTEKKNRQGAINQRNANYKAFLEEREEEETKNSHWAEFPGENSLSVKRNRKNSLSSVEKTEILAGNFRENSTGKVKKKKSFSGDDSLSLNNPQNSFNKSSSKTNLIEELSDNDETFVALKNKLDKVLDQSKNKVSNDTQENDDSDAPPDEHSSKVQVPAPPAKIKKVRKKNIAIKIESVSPENGENSTKAGKKGNKRKSDEESSGNKKKSKTEIKQGSKEGVANKKVKKEKSDKQKGLNQPKKIISENLTEQDLKRIEKKKQKKIKQLEKKKRLKAERKKQKEEEENNKLQNREASMSEVNSEDKNLDNSKHNDKFNNKDKQTNFKGKFDKPNTFNKKRDKFPRSKDGKDHQRRKPQLPSKMFINGKEIEIDYVDGFPVKKEDATRLKKLRSEMISKGLPRSEIDIALKLERRRAEKAFAREKKKVCFNCRKSGHNLSECPELNKDQVATSASGICFKCGSTEHTHFECKVVKGQEFKYAQCFICNEQGHISRQCPDNARGLYPKGGSCKVCGDVTHLKKDCPKYQAQQEQLQNNFNIETIGSSNPDVLDEGNNGNFSLGNRRPNKIIKF